MPTAKDGQESECPQPRIVRNLNVHSQGLSERAKDCQECSVHSQGSVRNLNAHSQGQGLSGI